MLAVAEQMQREHIRRLAPNLVSDHATRVGETAAPLLAHSEMLARWCELATRLYRFRRRRDRLFGSIFGEPAWDILLDLFVMEAKGKRVPVSSACIASGASHSTALRQIDELVRCKLVVRERDETDKRRTYVRLSDEGTRKMALTLEQLSSQSELRMADVIAHPTLLAG
jgi:DNA-binding MarR family transcriptional regulator